MVGAVGTKVVGIAVAVATVAVVAVANIDAVAVGGWEMLLVVLGTVREVVVAGVVGAGVMGEVVGGAGVRLPSSVRRSQPVGISAHVDWSSVRIANQPCSLAILQIFFMFDK